MVNHACPKMRYARPIDTSPKDAMRPLKDAIPLSSHISYSCGKMKSRNQNCFPGNSGASAISFIQKAACTGATVQETHSPILK